MAATQEILPLSESLSPSTHGDSYEVVVDEENVEHDPVGAVQKKKKKKKPKKSAAAKAKEAAAKKAAESAEAEGRLGLCISRNKHWRYISSYHGPWLQLPNELLESLLALNLDPATLSVPEQSLQTFSSSTPTPRLRRRGFESLKSEPDSPGSRFATQEHNVLPQLAPPPPLPSPKPGKAPPPPIDPGVFKNVTTIRRLIDEAAELSVRASSGLSAAELASPGILGGLNGSSWAAAQTLGINPLGGNGGRNVAMSAMRIHRLRALAVQKLAQAYKADEIASSVMVMQGGSVFDDVAEKVLKIDPNDADAKYVHFFHEKIPSRQLAESTTTQTLDGLIAAHPHRLEFYRTRGVVHCFRDEYPQAIKDFTHALKEARTARKARTASHDHNDHSGNSGGKGNTRREKGGRGGGANRKKKGRTPGARTNGQAPPNGTSAAAEDEEDETGGGGEGASGDIGDFPPPLHPSALPDAPDPIEPQLLFLRGSAYLQQAVHLIELAVLDLEGLDETARPKEAAFSKAPSTNAFDGSPEIRLSSLPGSLYGGVEVGNPAGPLGATEGPKLQAYRNVLSEEEFRDRITTLIKKSIRDHERFLGHFDTLEADLSHEKGKGGAGREDLKEQIEYAFLLSESTRPGNISPSSGTSSPYGDPNRVSPAAMFTTYHPLLVESHYSILLALLMLGDFTRILPTFIRTATLVDGLEGYPVFLPPRSMAQAEFVEVLERLGSGWKKASFEDEFALIPANSIGLGRRNGGGGARVASSSILLHPSTSSISSSSSSTSIYSAAGSSSSGSSSPATTITELYDDVVFGGIGTSSVPVPFSSEPSSSADGGPSTLTLTPSSSTSTFATGSSTRSIATIMTSSTYTAAGTQSSSPSPSLTSSPNQDRKQNTNSNSNSSAYISPRPGAADALDSLRILLAPVIARQKGRVEERFENVPRAEKVAMGNSRAVAVLNGNGKGKAIAAAPTGASSPMAKKSMPIHIPLHGPRVEVVLAWLGAVHLPELQA